MSMFYFQRLLIVAAFFCSGTSLLLAEEGSWTLHGYTEAYYNQSLSGGAPSVYTPVGGSYTQLQHPAINLAALSASYTGKAVRFNFGLQTGSFPHINSALEPGVYPYFSQANFGVKVSDRLWVDMGILPSHLGYEAVLGKDNMTLSRSLLWDNVPFFETGVKATYAYSDQLTLSGMVFNGWNHISNPNTSLALGTQLIYQPTEAFLFNYGTFLGNERPERFRHFHNLFAQLQLDDKTTLAVLADFGFEAG